MNGRGNVNSLGPLTQCMLLCHCVHCESNMWNVVDILYSRNPSKAPAKALVCALHVFPQYAFAHNAPCVIKQYLFVTESSPSLM